MAYESQMTNLARGATTAHGSLREVVFLKPNKESLLVFSDGTVLPISHQRAGYDIRRETYAYQVASELGGTDPFSLLTFGYSGTGPRCYAVFLSTAGFQNSNVEEIISPTKLRPDGSKVSGIEQGGSIVWGDRSETPRIQANEPGEANGARTDSTRSTLGIRFDI